jgi:hypothetical protein
MGMMARARGASKVNRARCLFCPHMPCLTHPLPPDMLHIHSSHDPCHAHPGNQQSHQPCSPLGSKSEPPLPPPMGRVVRLFLKICGERTRKGAAWVKGRQGCDANWLHAVGVQQAR